MTGPRRLGLVTLVGVLLLVGCRCAENVAPVRDCGGPGKTCATATPASTRATTSASVRAATPTSARATTPASAGAASKSVPKTTTTTTTLRAVDVAASDGVVVRYDVSGVGAGDRGAAPREIVTVDETFRRDVAEAAAAAADASKGDAARPVAGDVARNVATATILPALNAVPANSNTTSANRADATVKPVTVVAIAANTTTTGTTSTTSTTSSSTTTSSSNTTSTTAVGVSRTHAVRNGAQNVRFVPNSYCDCDLFYGSCDVNCCCDFDCTNHDLKSFTSCSDHAKSSGTIKPESILFDSSLFYVVVENVPSDYFYPERDAIESESQVAISLRNRDVFTWQQGEKSGRPPNLPPLPNRADSAYNSYDLTYKSLRWMYTTGDSGNNSSEIKAFGLKNSAFDSLCSVDQPVEYLVAKETNCRTFVSNLTDVCNNGSSLSFERYFGERGVFRVVQPINSNSQKTEKFGLVAVRATAHHRCLSADGSPYDCRVPSDNGVDASPSPRYHPVYTGGACRRVVDAVEYRLRHNGTGGVRAVDVHFRHRDVPDAGRPAYVSHRFGVRFDRAAADAGPAQDVPYRRSGKPGYATGSPVLVTAAAATVGRPPRPEPMVLPEPDGRGRCVGRGEPDDAETRPPLRWRRTVNFLEAADVRCRVRVRIQTRRRRSSQWAKRADEPAVGAPGSATDHCYGVQNETVAALGDYEGSLVASLGDPDVTRWIPVMVVKPPAPPPPSADGSCPSVIDGVHIRVLYSHVGTFDRPQATVLGMSVNYTATAVAVGAETARDRGDGSDDDGDANNNTSYFVVAEIPMRVTVIFVDLTRPPIRTFAEPPTYEFRLPEDFYYPFWSSRDGIARPPDLLHSSSAADLSRFEIKFFIPSLVVIACHLHSSARGV